MNLFIVISAFFSLFSSNDIEYKAKKIESLYVQQCNLQEVEYKCNYDSTINFIKYHEGFRANWYDDVGYKAIGYGQRQCCYKKQIIAPITKEQATEILISSFEEHMKMVKFYYPKLSGNKLLAVTHMSYCMGIGKINKSKLIVNEQLDTIKLLSFPHKENRKFEINLFNQ